MLVLKAVAAAVRALSFSVALVPGLEVGVGGEATSCLYDSLSTAL